MSIGFFPGLGSIMICACFNDLAQYSRRIMALNMYMRFSSPSCGNFLSIVAVMWSIPGAFFWFNFVISFLISFRVNGLRRSCWCIGVARSCSTYWLGSFLCGENTFERCSANRPAFSLSLLAQGPGGVEFLRIGGWDAVGFFLCFIGFQMVLLSLLRLESYALNDSFRISWRLDFNLLVVWLHLFLLSRVWVLCQLDLAFLF